VTKPDPGALQGVVSDRVLKAQQVASAILARAGVRHVVIGGLAVGANGYPRATRDVDFLVGSEAFITHEGGVVTIHPEVPFQVNGVAIDLLSPQPGEDFLEATLAAPPGSFVEAPVLVYLKLKSPRHKDRTDVIEMIKGGIDAGACRDYLERHAPQLVAALDEAAARAEAEGD
jgi:hypothetical protein